MKKLSGLFLLSFLLSIQLLGQETRTLTGRVLSAKDSTTIPGASVVLPSSPSVGTTTNIDGKFTLDVPANADSLEFSYVGMKTRRIPIREQSHLNVVMYTSSQKLEEVVVVGYGIQRKEALTSSVGEVKGDNLKEVSTSNVEKALQGNVAGVVSTSLRGMPGSAPSIRIRGATSINAGNQPLYVIDGVPVTSGESGNSQSFGVLSSLNPNDIASVSILKDASATAIYGSRASNGVVVITTKSGKSGKTKFNINVEKGYSAVNKNDFDMMNSSELLEYQREAVENSADYYNRPSRYDWTDPSSEYYLPDEMANVNTDWWDEVTHMGAYDKYNISASGGKGNTDFYISGSYHNNEGAIMNYGFERFTGNVKVNHSSSNERFHIGSKIMGSHSKQNYVYDYSDGVLPWENPIFASMAIPPYYKPFKENGDVNFDLNGIHGNYNPYGVRKYQDQYQNYSKILNSTYIAYDIIPEALKVKTTFGLDYGYTQTDDWEDPRATIYSGGEGAYYQFHSHDARLTNSTVATYDKTLAEKHNVNLMAGSEIIYQEYNYIEGGGKGATYQMPYLSTTQSDGQYISGNPSELSKTSLFGRLNYNYNGKYYFQASIRRDGSSSFGADYKYGVFGSISGGWTLTNEAFFNVPFIDYLKFRASYGSTGNSDIGWYASKGYYSTANYGQGIALLPDEIQNPDLRWERTTTTDVALDFRVLDNRIDGTVEYFWAKTTDNLLYEELSYTTGHNSVLKNIGSLMNEGLELTLNTDNIRGTFSWSTTFNITFPTSEILDLGGKDHVGGDTYRTRVGGKYLEYWMFDYAGVNPANGMPLWYDARGNLTSNYSDAARRMVGSPEPIFYGGLGNTLSYKGISLSFNFYYTYGNEVIFSERHYTEHDGSSWGDNANTNLLDRWQEPGDITDTPKPIVNNPTGSNDWDNSRWVDNGSYLRLKTLSLGYSLPDKWINSLNLSNVQIYLKGTNILTFSNVNGLDPERGAGGTGSYKYPNTRTFVLGLNLGF